MNEIRIEKKTAQTKEKSYVYRYKQKRESYPTFCNDYVKFPSVLQYIILFYRLLLT